MLLDQQRTRKITRIVAIVMVIGLVGVLPIALGMIIFGGDGQASTGTLIEDAEAKVRDNPRDIAALVALAAQYRADGRNGDAETTLDTAVAIGPADIDDLRTLVGAFGADSTQQSAIITKYVKKRPKDAQAWLLAGTIAANTGDVLGARLAYQRVLTLVDPDSATGATAQAGLDGLATTPTGAIVPTTPGTN